MTTPDTSPVRQYPACWPVGYLDVDGPLNPDVDRRTGTGPPGYKPHKWSYLHVDSLSRNKAPYWRGLPKVWLNPEHGAWLLSLPVAWHWATSWNHLANQFVGPAIGLPPLPVVDVGSPPPPPRHPRDKRLEHWKTEALMLHAAGRPFVWLDDEVTQHDRVFLAEHTSAAPKLLRHINPAKGLRLDDIEVIRKWIALYITRHDPCVADLDTGTCTGDCPGPMDIGPQPEGTPA